MGKDIKSFRKLKIGYSCQLRDCYSVTFPKILLQGNWLAVAGFKIGDSISLIVEHGKITISVGEGGQNG